MAALYRTRERIVSGDFVAPAAARAELHWRPERSADMGGRNWLPGFCRRLFA
jgi:hypothetical protein